MARHFDIGPTAGAERAALRELQSSILRSRKRNRPHIELVRTRAIRDVAIVATDNNDPSGNTSSQPEGFKNVQNGTAELPPPDCCHR